jgi:hypothetical protein
VWPIGFEVGTVAFFEQDGFPVAAVECDRALKDVQELFAGVGGSLSDAPGGSTTPREGVILRSLSGANRKMWIRSAGDCTSR